MMASQEEVRVVEQSECDTAELINHLLDMLGSLQCKTKACKGCGWIERKEKYGWWPCTDCGNEFCEVCVANAGAKSARTVLLCVTCNGQRQETGRDNSIRPPDESEPGDESEPDDEPKPSDKPEPGGVSEAEEAS